MIFEQVTVFHGLSFLVSDIEELVIKNKEKLPNEPKIGLRESNKIDKLQRIRSAAQELFNTNGYDQTTVRDIAEHARVGLGTLFSYAADKREILFLVISEELKQMIQDAFINIPKNLSLSEELLFVFKNFYEFFHKRPIISRLILRELYFYSSSKEALKVQKGREEIIHQLKNIIENAYQRNELKKKQNSILIARIIFSIYATEVRDWIAKDERNLITGLAELNSLCDVFLDGLK